MPRSFVPFKALWNMRIDIPYSFLVKDEGLAWSCGQLAMDRDSQIIAPGDLVRQSSLVCDYIESILARAEMPRGSIKRVYLYYVHSSDDNQAAMLTVFRQRFGDAVLLDPIRVPHFYYDGVVLEADVFCADEVTDNRQTAHAGDAVMDSVTANGLTWLTISSSLDSLSTAARDLRSAFGEGHDALLCEQWFAPTPMLGGTAEILNALRPSEIADSIVDTGPLGDRVTGLMTLVVDGQRTEKEFLAASDGVEIVVRRCGRFAWMQARSSRAELALVDQTRELMSRIQQELTGLGMTFQSVVKSTTHYVGNSSAEDLHDNMSVRNAYYDKPGPASTGVPVYGFSADASKVVVDVTAIAEPR